MKSGVLVNLDCYNRIPQSEWLINNRSFFLTVLESGNSKIKGLAGSVSGKAPLPGS